MFLSVQLVLNIFTAKNEEIIIFMLGCNYLSIINCLWYTRNILFLKILYAIPRNV
jgi:hypothetical protein